MSKFMRNPQLIDSIVHNRLKKVQRCDVVKLITVNPKVRHFIRADKSRADNTLITLQHFSRIFVIKKSKKIACLVRYFPKHYSSDNNLEISSLILN